MQHPVQIFLLASAVIFSVAAVNVHAALITFTTTGVGSGTLDTTTFTNQPFTITSIAETASVQNNPFSYGVNNLSTTVQLGASSVTASPGSSYAAKTADPQFAAFMWSNALVGDFIDVPEIYVINPIFFGYDLTSVIGPVAGTDSALSVILTNQGALSFESENQAQFTSTIVPEPFAIALITMIGLACIPTGRCRGMQRSSTSTAAPTRLPLKTP